MKSPGALPALDVVQFNVETLPSGELIADFLDVHSHPRPDSYLDAGHHHAPPAEQGLPRIGNLLPLTLWEQVRHDPQGMHGRDSDLQQVAVSPLGQRLVDACA